MSDFTNPIQRFSEQLDRLPGVKEIDFRIQGVYGISVEELGLPGPYADLPHAALRRTDGGRPNERVETADVTFFQNHAGWVAVEFLAWWVRDLSRSGQDVQMRPIALPPTAWGTQLGRTLRFVIEFFYLLEGEENEPVLQEIDELADSLESCIDDFREVLRRPTKADWKSVDEVRKCADRNDPVAMITMAELYTEGREGLPEDETEAYKLYLRAADTGHPEGKLQVGVCYSEGLGVPADLPQAAEYFRLAAMDGLPQAMGLLGQCYEDGAGVEKDPTEAAKWYAMGADQEDPVCLAQLGECYEHGRGVPKDFARARDFFVRALEQGFEEVQPALARVRKELGEK